MYTLCTNSIGEQFTAEVTLLVMIYSIGMRWSANMLLMTRWKWVETMRLWHRHRNNGIRLHWELLLIGDTAKTCDTARCWPNNRPLGTCLSGSRLNVLLRLLRQHSKLDTAHFVLIAVFFGTHFSDTAASSAIDRNPDGRCRGLSSAATGVFSSFLLPLGWLILVGICPVLHP